MAVNVLSARWTPMSELPAAPETPFGEDGSTKWGTYKGSLRTTDLSTASKQLGTRTGGRFFREKRWQWFAAANPQIACGGTLFDAGYATTVFLWMFDRTTERMIVDERELLPPFAVEIDDNPGEGGGARLRGLRRDFEFERGADEVTVELSVGTVRFELEFETTATEPMTAICPVGDSERSGVNVTQKESCLPVRGRIAAGGRTFQFGDGAYGMLDLTHGLLARETSWRWVIASGALDEGLPVGFNFSEEFNDDRENVVWFGDELQATGPVRIEFEENRPGEPWTVRSKDGAIDLSMIVEGVREHETNFQLVSSAYVQPIGRFHGRIVDREVHDLFGIAESHRARW